ncbi:DUF4876 domain-containing protein [Bacteroidales bacterium OttesenSCG-928-M11]|nr:DUF4876 domain-containing protein [Bacteroidales bacterium OttesenSCG-928-M11]
MNKLKNLLYLLMCMLVVGFTACEDNDDDVKTYKVSVQLTYPETFQSQEGVEVNLINASSYVTKATTDGNGIATFDVPVGIYSALATDVRAIDGKIYNLNGNVNNIVVDKKWDSLETVKIELTGVEKSQVIIKELYVGGCQKDDGSGTYINDNYVILYNNSDQVATLENLCLAATTPFNANGTNSDYGDDGKLFYEAEGWLPAGHTLVFYNQTLTIDPYEQVVIALVGAIDHTPTYSQSINFANPAYYCIYEPTVLSHSKYSAPSELIPTSHYFNAYMYGLGNGWAALSTNSPAFFIFQTDGVAPLDFASASDNNNFLWRLY